jgi:hypothetical protein
MMVLVLVGREEMMQVELILVNSQMIMLVLVLVGYQVMVLMLVGLQVIELEGLQII